MNAEEIERLAELSADGELDPREDAQLQAELARSAESREVFEGHLFAQAALRDKLQASAGGCPEHLGAQIHAQLGRAERSRGGLPWARAIPISLAVGLLFVLSFYTSESCPFTEAAVRAHSLAPPPEVRAFGEPENVQRFLSAHLDYPVVLPELPPAPDGPRLLGARLVTLAGRQAAYLIYEQGGARVSCFVSPRQHLGGGLLRAEVAAGKQLRVGQLNRYQVVSWDRGPLSYELVSDLDAQELVHLAVAD